MQLNEELDGTDKRTNVEDGKNGVNHAQYFPVNSVRSVEAKTKKTDWVRIGKRRKLCHIETLPVV